MNINNFFPNIVHLFHSEASTIKAVLAPEIAIMTQLIDRFGGVDLQLVSKIAIAAVTSGTPAQQAVTAVAQTLRAQLMQQTIEATDDEVSLVSQRILQKASKDVGAAVQAGQQNATAAGIAAPTTLGAAG